MFDLFILMGIFLFGVFVLTGIFFSFIRFLCWFSQKINPVYAPEYVRTLERFK